MRLIRQTGLLLGIGLLLIVLAVDATLAYRATVELHEAAADVDHSHEVIRALDALTAAALNAETGQRGYLITEEDRYLQPYEDAIKVIDGRIAHVDELTKDDPSQHDQMPGLRKLFDAKLRELALTVELRKTSPDKAREEVLTDKGKKAMDEIRDVVAAMQRHERGRLADRQAANETSFTSARQNVVFAAVLGFVAAAAFLWLLYRYLTAVKQVASEINTQRELLHTTLSSIGDGVITTDHDCQVSFLNSIAENLTGWSLAEAKGKHLEEIFRIVNEKTRQSVENPCTKVFREGIVVGLANHTVLIGKDGRERPIDDSAAPIRDDQGRLFGAVLVFRDATEQRAAAEARERLAAIVESSSDAIIAEDTNGVITSWNKAAEQLFGYTAEEAIGKSIRFIVPPELREHVAEKMEKIRQGEKVEFIDTTRIRKGDQRIEVSSHISPIRNKEGEVIGAAKVAHDISDRKRAERTLRFLADASAELAMLVDYQSTMQRIARLAVPFFADWCIVDIIDAKGHIQRVAHAHADRAKEPLLKEYVDRYPLDWNSSALSVRALRSGKPELISETPAAFLDKLAADAHHRELLTKLDPRSALSVPIQIRGTAVGTLNFVTSESGRRYSAADVELAGELARRSAIAIENAQLYRDLKEAHRQKDDFLAMLAHELRNPISPIQYANEISRIAAPSDYQASEVIDRQVQHLVHLIDDLLDVSRITRDKISLRREHVDAAMILQRAVATAEPIVKSRKHTLAVEAPSKPLPLFVDPTRAEQILVNLLINAAKYTPEGGQISAGAFAADGFAEFRIKDSGLGIPEPMLHRVFELFTQVNPSLDRSQGGLGIGLTVVRKLAELHGGSVSATSEGSGRGSEFKVRLPLAEAAPETSERRKSIPSSAAPQKMLVVDDNVDTARSIALLLERLGHKIEIAHDGYAALETAKSFRPDVVLLDLGLPGLDGYKVAERLRSDGGFHHTRLIALSGYGQPEDRKRSKEVGFDQHLVKPVDFETLLAVIAGEGVGAECST